MELPVQHWVYFVIAAFAALLFVAAVAYYKWVRPISAAAGYPLPAFPYGHIFVAAFLVGLVAILYAGYKPPVSHSSPLGELDAQPSAFPAESRPQAQSTQVDVHAEGLEIQTKGQEDLDEFRRRFLGDQ